MAANPRNILFRIFMAALAAGLSVVLLAVPTWIKGGSVTRIELLEAVWTVMEPILEVLKKLALQAVLEGLAVQGISPP
jgi:hypothetical protein